MITFTEAQLVAWLSPLLWPFLRVLAVFSVVPVLSMRAVPMRARIGLALLVALAAQPLLADQPRVDLNAPAALGVVVAQVGIGLTIGFAVRLVFTCIELAGELVGLQMGLNFAAFFDPTSNAQVSAVSRFFGYMMMLLFVILDGHLMVLMATVHSFQAFPVDASLLDMLAQVKIYRLGTDLFASALWIALPVVGMLFFVNIALGIISRVAPQMNIYAIGFPVTLAVGLVGIMATLPMLENPVLALMARVIDLLGTR